MKMNYPLQSKRRRSHARAALILIVVLFLLVGFVYWLTRTGFGLFFHAIGRPLWNTQGYIGQKARTISTYFSSKKSLSEENARLTGLLYEQEARLALVDAYFEENQLLKLQFQRTNKTEGIFAAILKRPSYSPYDTFVVDVGSNDGVKKNDPVTLGGAAALGYVSEVFARTSVIKLYSSPDETVNVEISGLKTSAVAKGRGNGEYEIKIPRDIQVEKGTKIFLAGTPPELVGMVEDVEADITHSLQTILFRNQFNIQELQRVFILTDNEK